VENTRSNIPLVGLYQDLTDPLVAPFSKGCHWNVDVEGLAQKANLREVESRRAALGVLMVGVYDVID